MRRIKSAPANICSMSNNKKVVVSQKENIAALIVSDQNEYNNFKTLLVHYKDLFPKIY